MKPASTTARALTAAPMACSATSRRKPLTKARFQSSLYSPVRWVWASMNPGESVASPRSMTLAPSGIGTPAPAADDPRALDQHHSGTHQLVRLAVEEPGGLDRRDGRLRLLGLEREGGDQGSDSRPRREPASLASYASHSGLLGSYRRVPGTAYYEASRRGITISVAAAIRRRIPVAKLAIEKMTSQRNCA